MKLKTGTQETPEISDWNYTPGAGYWDEFQTRGGEIRPHWRGFSDSLRNMGVGEFDRRWQTAQQMIRNSAITYNVYGDARGTERLWPLDPLPLILPEDEWAVLERAITQRATLLNTILNDCYGPQNLLRQHQLPPELVYERELLICRL